MPEPLRLSADRSELLTIGLSRKRKRKRPICVHHSLRIAVLRPSVQSCNPSCAASYAGSLNPAAPSQYAESARKPGVKWFAAPVCVSQRRHRVQKIDVGAYTYYSIRSFNSHKLYVENARKARM